MHFAMLCPPFTGHLNPMFAVGKALQARGHRSTFVVVPDLVRQVQTAGFGAAAVGSQSHPMGTLLRLERRLANLNGLRGLRETVRDMARMTDMLCSEGAIALRKLAPNAVVCDQLEAGGGLLARHLRLPHVSVANALMIDREPYVPPPFTSWGYARTAWARSRNVGGYRVSDWLMHDLSQVIARWSNVWRLRGLRTVEDCLSATQIGQLSPLLDFPRDDLPASFHYTGPLRVPQSDESAWQPPSTARGPFAFVSLGSLQGGRFQLIAQITQACRDEGLTAVVAHAGRLSDAQAVALPGAPIVEQYVAQRSVMACCDLVITHGGMNTVLDALSLGVPLVTVPLAMEQGAIAQRVSRAGAGVQMRSRLPSVRVLRKAISDALGRSLCSYYAADLATSLNTAGGATRAAQLIEHHAH